MPCRGGVFQLLAYQMFLLTAGKARDREDEGYHHVKVDVSQSLDNHKCLYTHFPRERGESKPVGERETF